MKKQVYFITAAIVAALSAAAFAHSGATGIVKERMDAMSAMGKAVKTISLMMMGESEYDAEVTRQGANLIKSHSGEAMTRLFPDNSLQSASVAKTEIWSNWQTFSQLADRLAVMADGLDGAAGNGQMASGKTSTGGMMGTEGSGMMGSRKSGMMGGGSMMAGAMTIPDVEQLAQMPVDGVFNMLTQTCSTCHTKFRLEKK
jgi:cytochrome c556